MIEYANISGRESDYRAYVRKAAVTVLSDIRVNMKNKQLSQRGLEKMAGERIGCIVIALCGLAVVLTIAVIIGGFLIYKSVV